MKINNSNINFGKVIKVTTNGLPNSFTNGYGKKSRHDSLSADITYSINNQTPVNFDKNIANQIRIFLKSNIKDINNQRVIGRTIEGDYYIFSGKEANKARKIIASAKKEKRELEDKYETDANENLYRIDKHNITLKQNEQLLKLAKNDEEIPAINIISDDDKIEAIEYITPDTTSSEARFITRKKSLSV